MEFVPVSTPKTESEIAVMVCLLDAYGIQNFVHNRGFGGLYPGLQVGPLNARRLMVPVERASEAIELLAVFAAQSPESGPGSEPEPESESDPGDGLVFSDKLRALVEKFFVG